MPATTNYGILQENLREVNRPDIRLTGSIIRLLEGNENFLYIIYMLLHNNLDSSDNYMIPQAKYTALISDIDAYRKKINFIHPEILNFIQRECHT